MDAALFHFVNQGLASPWLDGAMMVTSSRITWAVLGVLFLAWAAWRRDRRVLRALLEVALTVALVDFTAYHGLKQWVARERPCRQFHDARVPTDCSGDYGFPSNHAANGMAATVIVALTLGRAPALVALALTLLVGFSRVYLGVHFPGDVLGGFVVGALLALACHGVVVLVQRRLAARAA